MKAKSLLIVVCSKLIVAAICICGLLCHGAQAEPVILSGVPAYNWYHGCCPTAAASVFGYWDLHGYPNLFDAAGWETIRLTGNVQDQISSPAHNAKYDSYPDNPSLPEPPKTSIAGFMGTSVGYVSYGGTYVSDIEKGFMGYADFRGYEFNSWYSWWYSLEGGLTSAWKYLVNEINAGRPMQFATYTEYGWHCIPVFGYDDRGSEGLWYALYTTWSEDETAVWKPFLGYGEYRYWEAHYGIFIHPISSPVPFPSSLLLYISALGGIICYGRKKLKMEINSPKG
jgi:hypothetical protein